MFTLGGPQFTHVAGFQGAIAARNLLLPLTDKGVRDSTQGPPPSCTFTSPEVASVGLSEAEALRGKHGSEVAVALKPLALVDRAVCELGGAQGAEGAQGFIKIVYNPKKKGAILGGCSQRKEEEEERKGL